MESKPSWIREGRAKVHVGTDVFYNPVQCFNRDMSMLAAMIAAEDMKEEYEIKQKKRSSSKLRRNQDEEQNYTNKDMLQKENEAKLRPKICEEDGKTENFPGLKVLDALAASGLRALRYYLEVPYVSTAYANDFDEDAVKSIFQNIELNNINPSCFHANQGDASFYMLLNKNQKTYFNIIDLDPYGTAAPFIDAAIQSVADGGLLAVTCTDMGVLAGNHIDTCYNKYGVVAHKAKYCHEMALRILLSTLATRAALHGKYIVPQLSLSVDFYVRCFVRVFISPTKAKETGCHLSWLWQCNSCPAFWLQCIMEKKSEKEAKKKMEKSSYIPAGKETEETTFKDNVTEKFHVQAGLPFSPVPSLFSSSSSTSSSSSSLQANDRCPCCRVGRVNLGGPIWSSPLHSKPFLMKMTQKLMESSETIEESEEDGEKKEGKGESEGEEEKEKDMKEEKPKRGIFRTKKRMLGTLGVLLRELPDVPLYYSYSDLCGFFSVSSPPPSTFISYLLLRKYSVSQSHCGPTFIKTTAPPMVVFDFFKHLIQQRTPQRYLKAIQTEGKLCECADDEANDDAGDESSNELEAEERGENDKIEEKKEKNEEDKTDNTNAHLCEKDIEQANKKAQNEKMTSDSASIKALLPAPRPTRTQKLKENRVPALRGIMQSNYEPLPATVSAEVESITIDQIEESLYGKVVNGNGENDGETSSSSSVATKSSSSSTSAAKEAKETTTSVSSSLSPSSEESSKDSSKSLCSSLSEEAQKALEEAKTHILTVMHLTLSEIAPRSGKTVKTSPVDASEDKFALPVPRFIMAEKGFGPKAKAHKGEVSEKRKQKMAQKEEEKRKERERMRMEYAKVYGPKEKTLSKKEKKKLEKMQSSTSSQDVSNHIS
ncbi:putative N2,N2-dimethylguanosine tRNA methyltransferase [Monocercomonoides exilis]|uniref:putative N2,N2-dimethylguanosine tRNA methyltransferase n=1 Tax=Monocercomonoides exilis TaxID=2049356 RepID=UPI0035593BD6|nr:putative N2,N2-dimethylguanosine tRNA methyltransferase [Monocercomonoides exilis]|eukprot:MONOS_13357.1-p1 / transcript=MONOS_13357.1 / gene=MONOS_13357 / organism=Monocercomonoides_exilis_PA203 / gene_product=N / transcript_product=N / location=Mono_scaffold00816:8422-11824(-) / protein_length=881 / sequence_SO=supercontig / SO=protein_coding / is_pseudo=false